MVAENPSRPKKLIGYPYYEKENQPALAIAPAEENFIVLFFDKYDDCWKIISSHNSFYSATREAVKHSQTENNPTSNLYNYRIVDIRIKPENIKVENCDAQ